jgi:hypothetical protein
MALEAGRRNFHRIYFNGESRRTEPIVAQARARGVECLDCGRPILSQLARHSSKEVGVHQVP